MNAVVLMATPCPKSLHGKGEKWIATFCRSAGPGLATADDCDDGEEVSRVRLRYPKHLMSCTIALAHNSSIFAWIFAAKDFCREGIRSDCRSEGSVHRVSVNVVWSPMQTGRTARCRA